MHIKIHLAAACLLPVLLSAGCVAGQASVPQSAAVQTAAPSPDRSPSPAPVPTSKPSPEPFPEPSPTPPPVIDYQKVKPYEVGQIMVIMYHELVTSAPGTSYQRTVADFKADLQNLYDGGYRLISVKDLAMDHIAVEAGYTPVIITFDDGKSTAFSLTEQDGGLRPAADCAVALLTAFAQEHPDFGNTAVFFINGATEPFKGAGTLAQRLGYLVDHGYEIGNHSYSHASMSDMDADAIQAEIGRVDQLIRKHTAGYVPIAFSYPYGERPAEEYRGYILNGSFEGQDYHYELAFNVGQSGSPSAPDRTGFDPLNMPRVRGSDNAETDLGWSLRRFRERPELRYISDGNPDRIAVPEQYRGNVQPDTVTGREIYFYGSDDAVDEAALP